MSCGDDTRRRRTGSKVWRDRTPDPLDHGLRQLDEHLSQLGLDHGALVIFDRRQASSEPGPDEHIAFEHVETAHARAVTLLRA